MAALGPAEVARLELRYVELPGLLEHVVTMPAHVNVVPGEQAAGRIIDPTVRTEVAFQEAQQSKRLASEALERGDRATAKNLLDEAVRNLDQAGPHVPDELRSDIQSEVDEMNHLRTQVDAAPAARMSKLTRASYQQESRKRGPRPTE